MLYFAQGTAIVTEEEYRSKSNEVLPQFFAGLDRGKSKPVPFTTGVLTLENVIQGWDPGDGSALVPFKEIGLGKPLTIQIHEVYTGQHPAGGFFGNKKALLLTSAVKSIATFDAKPRAINFLKEAVSAKSRLARPRATEQGTPFAYYSPALVDRSLTLDLSMVFDQFPQQVFDTIGSAFQVAAGIPIFLAQSVYLLAASALAKIVGSVGEAFFDGHPVFEASVALDIDWPGSEPHKPGFFLIAQDNVDLIDSGFRTQYQVNNGGQVVDVGGKLYSGDIPYIVISVDGTPHEELTSFAPTAASSALLSRFLGIKGGQSQPLGPLLDAVKLYNDFQFRQQVDRLDTQITKTTDPADKAELEKRRGALAKNILSDLLQPQS